jgi:beta-glucosidase
MEPWITLYHWDLPQALEAKGGWANREVVNWYAEWANVCTTHFGDRVKHWVVMNEPMTFTGMGYFLDIMHRAVRASTRFWQPHTMPHFAWPKEAALCART